MKQKYLLLVLLIALLPQMANAQWPWESAEDLHKQGMQYYKTNDYNNAISYFSKAGDKGMAQSYNMIGIIYLKGLGGKQDFNKAFQYFALGYDIDKNRANSNYWIGYCYYSGCGVNQNLNKAVQFFKIAADKGSKLANRYLGMMYYLGEGVPRNYANAVHYLNFAVNEGDSWAKVFLGACYYEGTGVPMDKQLGRQYLESAVRQGNDFAQDVLNGYNRRENVNAIVTSLKVGWYVARKLLGD
ncbi:MAG: tetratricopeptide repeat protein [Bacteroidales bacterium]|nr:tetratricopeptide repeat protein [Bacteroidales bacterium]